MFGPHRLPCETPEAHFKRLPAEADRKWVLPATILGSSLGFIDSSAVNVALPAIRDDLAADLATVQWVVNGYMLTLASLILLGGTAGDRYGRRAVFLVGLVAFAASSLACGFAPSAMWLILARFVQGAGAALLVALLRGRIGGLSLRPTIRTFVLVTVASAVLAGVSYGVWWALDQALGRVVWAQIVSLGAALAAGGVAYLISCRLLGVRELEALLSLRARFRRT